jgi:flagellar hook-associated protein 3 FlgL
MRISEGMIANTILNNLQLGQSRLAKLQQQVSSGLKISTPGDDPASAQQLIQLKGLLQDAEQYARNIAYGNSWLEQSDSAMADMGNVVTRAREISVQMANGTYSAQDRINTASELKQLKDELIQLGNTQVAGKYIFGGFLSDTL